MSNFSRPMPSHLRGQSIGASQQSTFLQQKIADKKTELANLKDLQALSGGLADQMQMLADKLQTLSDGTEGVLHFESTYAGVGLRKDYATICHYANNTSQLLQQCSRTGIMYFERSTWLQVGLPSSYKVCTI
jgi:hypothetical protein